MASPIKLSINASSETKEIPEKNINNRHIVVFGETGVGKSSIINMILGSKEAPTSSSSIGCTFEHKCYHGSYFTFHDTVGFNEGSEGTMASINSLLLLRKLVYSLNGGVYALIYVIKKGRITDNIQSNYNFFYETICERKVPIILVITHCELETNMGEWWLAEKAIFDKYQLFFKQVVSGTAIKGEELHPMFQTIVEKNFMATEKELSHMLEKLKSSNTLYWVPPSGYLQRMRKILSAAWVLLFGTNEKYSVTHRNQQIEEILINDIIDV